MSVALPIPLIQLLQVLTVAVGAPGVTGVIAKVEARLQGRRGPRIAQPYYDLAKLFRKEALAPEGASWFFLAAPVIAVAAYLTIPLLIPVLTSYPLPLGYMGDILGGGFLLSLASFSVHVRHVDAGSDGSEEWEIQALLGPVYDIGRLGVFFTASPRHADVLLVTGPAPAACPARCALPTTGCPTRRSSSQWAPTRSAAGC